MNILHIVNGWPDGGILEQVYLLCKHLPKEFKQYSAGFCHFDGNFVKKFELAGVPCLQSDEQYSNILDLVAEHKIDIVHKHTGGGDYPEYVDVLYNAKIPLVETIYCPRKTGIPFEKARYFVYTTPYTLEKNDVSYKEKMISIQYALDLAKPIFDSRIHSNDHKLKVGRLCRLVPDKRTDVLLNLAAMSVNGELPVEFHLAGVIPQDYAHHIEHGDKILKQIEGFPNITYHGYIENKFDFWKTLDICINPVWEASFDIVFLEAMACGIPIITWNNSAAPHVVRGAGLVTRPYIYDMFLALVFMAENPPVRTELGSNGIEMIKTIYSLENNINAHIDLYRSVAKEL